MNGDINWAVHKHPAAQQREQAAHGRELADTEERRARGESASSEAEGFRMLAEEARELQDRYFVELAKVRQKKLP